MVEELVDVQEDGLTQGGRNGLRLVWSECYDQVGIRAWKEQPVPGDVVQCPSVETDSGPT